MIANTHTAAKVCTEEYRRVLAQAVIDKNRVSAQELAWLGVPPAVGTGAYNDEARGWMDVPDHNGAERRFTPKDGPKGASP